MTIFNLKKFARSFSYAGRGFKCVLKEQNFRVQILFSIIVVFLILFFGLKVWEAAALAMMIILVLVLEIINSIFERIMDILEPRVHPHAKTVKDMMAAAVLIASIGAAFVGIVIFWPYFSNVIYNF
ncbi:MAG: diacylglycerol kinase [Candidatus Pacebacteria bacterium]|nr:diacylglycerol kinase [Candidatus Paceibacterota bacterium]